MSVGKNFLINLSRITIGVVFFLNIQAGILFFMNPVNYLAAYQLTGIPGQIAVSGTGLLFLMWNIPYAFALWNPLKNRLSLIQAILMQALGLFGEIILLNRINQPGFDNLKSSIQRFVIFDSAGLILLVIAFFLVRFHQKNQPGE